MNFWLQAHFAVIDGAKFYGNIALRGCYGFFQEPGPTGANENRNTLVDNDVAVDPACNGFGFAGTQSATITNVTALNAGGAGGTGVSIGACSGQGCGGGSYSFTGRNILTMNGATHGLRVEAGIQTWAVRSINSFRNANNYDPGSSGNYTNKHSQDAGLGACKVWIPDSSPMKQAGEAGAAIGANVLYHYTSNMGDETATLTSTPLWDPTTGAFSCGAVIAGVNDTPGDSRINVHERL